MSSPDAVVSRITNGILMVDVAISTLTVPLAALLLYVLMKDRTHSGSFFTIYKVGLMYDIFALVILHIIGVIPSRGGVLNDAFMESPIYLNSFYFFNYYTHTCQGITNLLLSLNRATAVLLPLYHRRIWSARFTLPICFIFQFCLGLHFGEQSIYIGSHLMHYSTGERLPMPANTPEVRTFWLKTFITAISSCLFTIVLYSIVVWRFPIKRVRPPRTKKEVAENRQALSLLCVAIIVMVCEAIYILFYCHSFVTHINFEKDFRIFYVMLFGITDLYSCVPTYLLVIFCRPIRQQLVRFTLKLCIPQSNAVMSIT